MDSSFDNLILLVFDHLFPELCEDEVYVWEIISVSRLICSENPDFSFLGERIERDADFMKNIILETVRKILTVPGVETYLTGWPIDRDGKPRRVIMPVDKFIKTISSQLDQLGREPTVEEIAFFRVVESGCS